MIRYSRELVESGSCFVFVKFEKFQGILKVVVICTSTFLFPFSLTEHLSVCFLKIHISFLFTTVWT